MLGSRAVDADRRKGFTRQVVDKPERPLPKSTDEVPSEMTTDQHKMYYRGEISTRVAFRHDAASF